MRHKAWLVWRSPPRFQPVAVGAARGGRDRGDAAQMREGGLAAQSLGVVAGGDQELAGGVDPDPGQRYQGGRGRGDQFLELAVELGELGLELLPAPGQEAQSGLGGGGGAGERSWPHGRAHPHQGLGLAPKQRGAQLFGGAVQRPVQLLGGCQPGLQSPCGRAG
jgi:hypothetical protein